MARVFEKPVVWVSACLGFKAYRYNGQMLPGDFLDVLAPFVEYRQVCPEVEIGLGVPRHPVRMVQDRDGIRLRQYETGRDVTADMVRFADRFHEQIGESDGFVLKSRSPSCGIKDVRIYPDLGPVQALSGKGRGLFAAAVIDANPNLPVEDEGRLHNYRIREHFLTRIFAGAHWRAVKRRKRMKELVAFQAAYKYALMMHGEAGMRLLGRIVANHAALPVNQVFEQYGKVFLATLAKPPRATATINVLSHIFGHVSDALSKAERTFVLDSFEMYREERTPLSVPLSLLLSFAIRFGNDYLREQVVFEPFPRELLLVTDSGKGRDSLR